MRWKEIGEEKDGNKNDGVDERKKIFLGIHVDWARSQVAIPYSYYQKKFHII